MRGRALLPLGLLFAAAGVLSLSGVLGSSEKNAVKLFGHWFDLDTSGLALMALGLLLGILSRWLRRGAGSD